MIYTFSCVNPPGRDMKKNDHVHCITSISQWSTPIHGIQKISNAGLSGYGLALSGSRSAQSRDKGSPLTKIAKWALFVYLYYLYRSHCYVMLISTVVNKSFANLGFVKFSLLCLRFSWYQQRHTLMLTHCGLVRTHGDIRLGQHWCRWYLIARRHQAISSTNGDLSSVRSSDYQSPEGNFTWDTPDINYQI